MNEERLEAVQSAYKHLEQQAMASGIYGVTGELLQRKFNPSKMPDVEAGSDAGDFHNLFCQLWHAPNEIIGMEEFVDFHQDISTVFENDEDFLSLVAYSWLV